MIKVFGDGLDALLTINLLLNSGHKVKHYSSNDKFGGHFRGIKTCGGNFDAGMVLLEPDFIPGAAKDLDEYEGEFGRNSRVYLEQVFNWLEIQMGGLINHNVRALLPSLQEVPDYFIGDSLEFLSSLDLDQRSRLQDRITSLLKDNFLTSHLHPSSKTTSELAAKTPLIKLLLQVYGEEIYETYFKGFLEKVTGVSLPLISSRDNRRVWMPNYYPESILFALDRNPKYLNFELDSLRFLRPGKGQIADFVFKLQDENESNVNYQLNNLQLGEFEFDLANQDSLYFINISDFHKYNFVDFNFTKELAKRNKSDNRFVLNSIDITHFCVSKCTAKTVFVTEASNQVVRYSFYSSSQQSAVSVESISGDLEPKQLAQQLLTANDLEAICDGYSIQLPLRIQETDFSIYEWYCFLDQFKSRYPSLNQNIFLIHPEANNFNDNLLRGLAAFRKREISESK